MNKKDKYGYACYGNRDIRKKELRRYLRYENRKLKRMRKESIEDLINN